MYCTGYRPVMDRRLQPLTKPVIAKKLATRIFHSRISRRQENRICTLFIYTVCGAMCLWQIGTSLSQYCDQSVVSRVNVAYLKNFVRPSFTMCMHLPAERLTSYVKMHCASSASCTNYLEYPLRKLNLTTESLWYLDARLNLSNDMQILRTPCAFAVNFTRCETADGISGDFNNNFTTIFGRCMALYQTDEFYYSADTNSVLAVFGRNNLANLQYETVAIALHANRFISKHNMVYTTKRYKIKRDILFTVLSIVEFNYLNESQNPCVSEEEAVRNYDDCIDEVMREYLPCELPFIKGPRLRSCLTFHDFLQAYERSKMFYRMRSKRCRIQKRCKETVYTFAKSELAEEYLVLTITIPRKIKIIVSEFYAYTLSQFFSESVGNVGFFLNFTLVTFTNALQLTINSVRKKIISKNGTFLARDSSNCARTKKSFVDKYHDRLIHWLLSSVSIGLCLWQLTAFLDNFQHQSLSTRVNLVKMETLRFPYVTICPTSFVTIYFGSYVSRVCANRGRNCASSPFRRINASLEEFVRAIDVRPEDLKPRTIPCEYAVNESRCVRNRDSGNSVFLDAKTNRVPTAGGQCTMLNLSYKKRILTNYSYNTTALILPDDEFNPATGASIWSIEIIKRIRLLNTSFKKLDTTMLTAALHHIPVRLGYSFYAHSNSFTAFTNHSYLCKMLIVAINEVRRLNPDKNPCVDEYEALEKYNRCKNRKLESILPCKIFDVVSTKLRPCDSLNEFWQAYKIRQKWILTKVDRDCEIKRRCNQTIYKFFIEQVKTSTDEAMLTVEFATDRKEITTEIKSYSLSSLFTDISNTLSFYLGFSLISYLTRVAQSLLIIKVKSARANTL